MTEKSVHLKYSPHIDGLRAFAVISVILVHYFPKVLPGGFVGVDIFFVISGFLITFNILKDSAANNFSFLKFYASRAKRILPALIFVLLSIWLLGCFTLDSAEFSELSKELDSGTSFLLNFHMSRASGYFDISSFSKPFLHLWSLSLEEQFYLILPIGIFFVIRKRSSLYFWFSLFFILSFTLNIVLVNKYPVPSFYLLPTRFWEFLLGGMLALMKVYPCFNDKISHKIPTYLLFLIETSLFTLLLLTLLYWDSTWAFPGWAALIPTLFALMLIGMSSRSEFNKIFLSSNFMAGIGRISYPLYLWHWPLLSIASIISGNKVPLTIRLILISLAFTLAYITYKFIEQPIKKKADNFSYARQIISGIFIQLLVLSVGLATLAFHGFDSRNINLPRLVSKQQIDRNLGNKTWEMQSNSIDNVCRNSKFTNAAAVDFCRLTSQNPKIAIIGDSHANHLVPGFVNLDDKMYSNLIQLSYGGCDWVGDFVVFNRSNYASVPDCFKSNNRFLNLILNEPEIQTVVFSYASQNLFNPVLGTYPLKKSVEGKLALNDTFLSLSKVIGKLEVAGKKVVFIIDVPHMPFDIKDCVYIRPFSSIFNPSPICHASLNETLNDQKNIRNLFSKLSVAYPNLIIVDLPSLLCSNGECPLILNNKLIYRDSNHLSVDGSDEIAILIKAKLAEQINR